MNANYLYDVCAYNDEVGKPGFDIALAMYAVAHPLPKGMDEKSTVHFWASNYDRLVAAYAKHDRKHFAEIVDQLAERAAKPEA